MKTVLQAGGTAVCGLVGTGRLIGPNRLPLILESENDKPVRLRGHMTKANSQWQHCNDRLVLAIFQVLAIKSHH